MSCPTYKEKNPGAEAPGSFSHLSARSCSVGARTDLALGDALLEYALIDGDESEYGLYVKKVNGITAEYEKDKSYWAFYKDGEYMQTGVDSTEIADGEHYELVYTK